MRSYNTECTKSIKVLKENKRKQSLFINVLQYNYHTLQVVI